MKNLPQEFIEQVSSYPGHEGVAETMATTESPTAIRINPMKELGMAVPSDAERIAWEPNGYYLPARPQFTFMPALYDGKFYVQDPSSMIIGEVIRRLTSEENEPVRYMDACAAPGGKTTSAIAALPSGSFVFANEYDASRAASLIENLQRWGATRYAVGRSDARKLGEITEAFDIVSADVPCSGEGMMRKNDTAITQWSKGLIESCAYLQREIVTSVWNALRPGGYLIYSTCTFNTKENEENAEWIIRTFGAKPVDLGLTTYEGVLPGIDTDIPCVRMVPGKVKGEGQFMAVFQKPGDAKAFQPGVKRNIKGERLPSWIEGNFIGIQDKSGNLYGVESEYADFVSYLRTKTAVIVPGINVATPKGRDMMPGHALATSVVLKEGVFPEVETDYATALSFLRGEALRLESSVPKGYVLVTHGGNRLGWAKNIGSRANNLMPGVHRIRSQHTPEDAPELFG